MIESPSVANCPACGNFLSSEADSEGLCPRCLVELALESPTLMSELQSPDQAETLTFESGTIVPGRILGKRYRIRSLLGRGGMGEVWQATDLKLRVDVALKALRSELLTDLRALEGLRQEVRAAREVVSPNVCRVFDLVELDDQELVSMEYIDGITLLDILKMRAPLELSEAREIAAQLLAGLEAIHDAGLVHRDVKPENLMMTRSGRVVLMDFGIAKGLAQGGSETVSGTPAYMSPEQARGESLDARADVYSAGVVLTEMIATGGLSTFGARQRIWEKVRHQPPDLPDSPWAPVLRRALTGHREQRHASAAALARDLEEVTLRVAGAEEVRPYPGLASFTEDDVDYFFGRELEVEAMWKRLQRSHLLGLIGPSGTGKSSFLRAGLLPVRPTGWRTIIVSPGGQPFSALARELVPELSADTEALQWLTNPDDPEALLGAVTRWRQQHTEALLIVDQFEELFTQNSADRQEQFADLLARFALEADVHVLLAMRDDFLAFCSHHTSLVPIFTHLTPLKPLTGASIRRALVQPALKCGYRFEDDSLVDEMLGEVSNERGALPLLAFAASRLWDDRDRDEGLLTREAYEQMGGVVGALAQHAERTLEIIGRDRIPVVRELLRNLVTPQGTRAVRDRTELLSVFGMAGAEADRFDDSDAGEVLDALIDARLLNSYEIPGGDEEDGATGTQIEVIHESLLSNWPRLVRWQTQDADGAQLRDQIRQAAQMWEERGRPEDLLWTGTSFSEYRLWRERYSGGLSSSEEEFARAMTSRAQRRVRQRRMTIAGAFVLLLAGLAVVGLFWRQSVAQAHRAEANQLLTLGRVEMEANPTAALAYAQSSLEILDTAEARLLALEALWRGPPATVLEGIEGEAVFTRTIDFSPDGTWIATADENNNLKLWSRSGGPPRVLGTEEGLLRNLRFGPDSSLLATRTLEPSSIRLWSIPEGDVKWSQTSEHPVDMRLLSDLDRLFVFTQEGPLTRVISRPVGEANSVSYGRLAAGLEAYSAFMHEWTLDIDRTGSRMAFGPWIPDGGETGMTGIYLARLDELETSEPERLTAHPGPNYPLLFHPDGRHLIAGSTDGILRVYALQDGPGQLVRTLRQPPGWIRALRFDATGTWLASASLGGYTSLWNLEGPVSTTGTLLSRSPSFGEFEASFHPDGDWLATAGLMGATLWPIDDRYPCTLTGHDQEVVDVAFHPDGERLVSASNDGSVKVWPLSAGFAGSEQTLFRPPQVGLVSLSIDRSGDRIATGSSAGRIWVVPMDESAPIELTSSFQGAVTTTAFSQDGALVAAAGGVSRSSDALIRIWNLVSGESEVLDAGDGMAYNDLEFAPDGRLISASIGGLRIWSLESATSELLDSRDTVEIALSRDGRYLFSTRREGDEAQAPHGALVWDLYQGTNQILESHKDAWRIVTDDAAQVVVTSSMDGEGPARVSRIAGGSTHLIFDRAPIFGLAVSPNGRWIAGLARDETIRLWPVPDLSRPPLHTLPHDELLETLDALTNMRVVKDSNSRTGWRIRIDPFPGWERTPTW